MSAVQNQRKDNRIMLKVGNVLTLGDGRHHDAKEQGLYLRVRNNGQSRVWNNATPTATASGNGWHWVRSTSRLI